MNLLSNSMADWVDMRFSEIGKMNNKKYTV